MFSLTPSLTKTLLTDFVIFPFRLQRSGYVSDVFSVIGGGISGIDMVGLLEGPGGLGVICLNTIT